jgi:hypothetical protein
MTIRLSGHLVLNDEGIHPAALARAINTIMREEGYAEAHPEFVGGFATALAALAQAQADVSTAR